MPLALRKGAYRFRFYSNENREPPHVHVRRENREAKFWLDPVALQDNGGFAAHEVNRILRIIQDHRELLLEKWHEHHR
jgi:Domain of unknown function (DUF4160)